MRLGTAARLAVFLQVACSSANRGYLTVGYASASLEDGATLYAVDAAGPAGAAPAFTDTLDGGQSSFVASSAFVFDPATGRRTRLGSARALYVRSSRLY